MSKTAEERLLARLAKGPLEMVVGQSGWRAVRCPSGVRQDDIKQAIRAGIAHIKVGGMLVSGDTPKNP